MNTPLSRFASMVMLAIAILSSSAAIALVPYDTVMDQLGRFRSASGDIVGEGRLTYGPFEGVAVRMLRHWNEPPRFEWGDVSLRAHWEDTQLDIVLRLVGMALSAEDLPQALQSMGRSLEPVVSTLWFIGDDLVYVIGGSMTDPVVRLFVERDTYRLRRIELPMPEGLYRLDLEEYDLAQGWLPRVVTVSRDQRELFRLELASVSHQERP